MQLVKAVPPLLWAPQQVPAVLHLLRPAFTKSGSRLRWLILTQRLLWHIWDTWRPSKNSVLLRWHIMTTRCSPITCFTPFPSTSIFITITIARCATCPLKTALAGTWHGILRNFWLVESKIHHFIEQWWLCVVCDCNKQWAVVCY